MWKKPTFTCPLSNMTHPAFRPWCVVKFCSILELSFWLIITYHFHFCGGAPGVSNGLFEHASTAGFFASTSSDQICFASTASTLENTTGEQRALRKYFPLAEKPQALFLLLNAPSNLSDTSTIRDTFASYLESDPGYGMYNCVNLCYCRVLWTKLDSQIHWNSVPPRDTFISVLQNLQSTI